MSKEAWDDIKRFQRDKEANSQKFEKLTQEGKEILTSDKIKVGDLICLNKDQRIPADMILLRTSDKSGACFIRTDQLDGETDWKLRLAVSGTQNVLNEEKLTQLQARVTVDKPHKNIHHFVGTMDYLDNSPISLNSLQESLSVENTVWANTVLASGSAIGLVIYTGKDTRAVMNTSHPQTKVGLLDWEINRMSKILCFFTLALALVLVALNQFRGLWYIYLVRFLILFSSIIPIRCVYN